MKIDIPHNTYIKKIEVNDGDLSIDFAPKKKVALLFISLNARYWPYLTQVIKDCRTHFLPHHKVDYFAWTDFSKEEQKKQMQDLDDLLVKWEQGDANVKQQTINTLLTIFSNIIRLHEQFYAAEVKSSLEFLSQQGITFKRDGANSWMESTKEVNGGSVALVVDVLKTILRVGFHDMENTLKGTTITETAGIEWPAPTLMRYHLFLNQEEKLKDYDYIFYLDADMRVVDKISDEILGTGLTAAEHPMYSLRKEYIAPYEPNPNSTAYIRRPGKVVDTNGQPRFKPYYYAGGFQGGIAKDFIEAMQTMKKNIDKDFDNNYTAIWNDESHWNKYLFGYQGDTVVLSPSYVYPDSLIDEYYVKVWGQKYEPKIITLTKPFTLSRQGADEINKFVKS